MYFSLYIILIIFIQTSATKNSNKKFIYIKKSYKNTNISYKTYKKVLILINSSTKTRIWNLFFDDYKIFGNLSKVREVLL